MALICFVNSCFYCPDLVMIWILDRQYHFVLTRFAVLLRRSCRSSSYGLSGVWFASQTVRSRTLKSCRCLPCFLVWVTVLISTTVRGLIYVFAFQREFSFESDLKGFVPLARRTFRFGSRSFNSGQPTS